MSCLVLAFQEETSTVWICVVLMKLSLGIEVEVIT